MSFATELTALKNSITAFISQMNKNFSKNVYNNYVPIVSGGSAIIDLQQVLGTNHALYDKKRVKVTVRVKDVVVGSATLNMYINADAVAVVAIDAERYVNIINQHTADLTFYICIDVPKI